MSCFEMSDEDIEAALERYHEKKRILKEYRNTNKGKEMGEKFMELVIIANDIPKGCIQCQSLLHMGFYCRDHPHPVVRSFNRFEHPLEDVEVIEEMMLMLISHKLLMWTR